MFTWINKQGVRSDKGFEVQFTGRFEADYREGDKVVTLYVESGYTDKMEQCILVEPNAFDSWNNGRKIAEDKKSQMFQNLKEALEFQGLKLAIQ